MPDELPDDDWETASRRRQAEVDRILSSVAATFTGPQQRIYELSIRQGLRGQALATALQITEKNANDDTYENITRLEEGFGAYILAREGRPFCAVLAGILDFSEWDGLTFTRVLRLRVLKHLDTCPTCGNCETCRDQKKRLIRPYAPALLPIVSFSWLHDRVMEAIRDKPATQGPGSPPRPPAALMALPPMAGARPAAAPARPREWRPPPPAPGRSGRGRGSRRLRPPAMFGAAAVLPFVLALFITRMAAGGDPPGPGLAAMPTIAYVTGTSLVTRQGSAPPRTLAAAPAGSLIWQLFWSADKRWLAWFSGPAQDPFSQVNITDTTTGATHAWPCNGCSTAAFQNDRLLVNTSSVASGVASYPRVSTTSGPSFWVPLRTGRSCTWARNSGARRSCLPITRPVRAALSASYPSTRYRAGNGTPAGGERPEPAPTEHCWPMAAAFSGVIRVLAGFPTASP
jgi:hypothetical protein